MTSYALPLIDLGRTEFGFARSICDCSACTNYCRHLPGYLVPADLERMQRHLAGAMNLFAWATEHLLSSPGALVMRRGKVFRIPTLVPARRADGACLFLTAENRCRIHQVAPFGCAFFDEHQNEKEANRRSSRGLESILNAWLSQDLYAEVWVELYSSHRRAPAPEDCRERLRARHTPDEFRELST